MANEERAYALGHSERELDRLSRQALAFRPLTKALFEQAGITRGMRVLDIGCGSGDVSFLAAELVGAEGEVVGVDRAADAVERATARRDSSGFKNVRFVQGDPTTTTFERPFDAVVGRLVLMYFADPLEALRRIAGHVGGGGLVVFQEFDMANCRSMPESRLYTQCMRWLVETLERTGARTRQGMELFRLFQEAGLRAPRMRHDALVDGGPGSAVYDMVVDVARSLLPVMEKLGIASASEVGIDTLADRMRTEVVAGGGVLVSPALVGAWSRKTE